MAQQTGIVPRNKPAYTRAGSAPRRLLQTHGAFINVVLSPGIRVRRRHGGNSKTKMALPVATITNEKTKNNNKRVNDMYAFTSNDEVFDVRAGEVLVSSHKESGFPASRRGALFSSLNGYDVKGTTPRERDPENALIDSDIRFVGLCQNDFVSSDTALQDQGMVCQMSGIKTIINESESTIHIGQRLRMAPLTTLPTIGRKGIPLEKARLILKPVDDKWLPTTAFARAKAETVNLKDIAFAKIATAATNTDDEDLAANATDAMDELLTDFAAQVVLEWRKCARMVVATAGSNAKPGEQVDVLVQKPNIV